MKELTVVFVVLDKDGVLDSVWSTEYLANVRRDELDKDEALSAVYPFVIDGCP